MLKVIGKVLVGSMLIGSLALAGCGKGDCKSAVNNTMGIMKKEMLAALPAEAKAEAEKEINNPEKIAEMVKECEEEVKSGKMTKEQVKCAADAKSMADLQKCDKGDKKE